MSQQIQVQTSSFSKLPELDGLKVIKGDVPEPSDGEVLCQIYLRPINPTDVHQVQGLRPIGPHDTPHIAGGEGTTCKRRGGCASRGDIPQHSSCQLQEFICRVERTRLHLQFRNTWL